MALMGGGMDGWMNVTLKERLYSYIRTHIHLLHADFLFFFFFIFLFFPFQMASQVQSYPPNLVPFLFPLLILFSSSSSFHSPKHLSLYSDLFLVPIFSAL